MMITILKKAPFLKLVVVLVCYFLFLGNGLGGNQSLPAKPPSFQFTLLSSATTFTAGVRVDLLVNISSSPTTGGDCETSYYPLDNERYYLVIYDSNGNKIDSIPHISYLSYQGGASTVPGISFPRAGTYQVALSGTINGMYGVSQRRTITITGDLIALGKYKLIGFSYVSNGGDTTFTYPSPIDTNKNYINFTSTSKMTSLMQLPFTAAQKTQYKWLTVDSLKLDYNNGRYSILGTAPNFSMSLSYDGRSATFTAIPTATTLTLQWKYGGPTSVGPRFTLNYAK